MRCIQVLAEWTILRRIKTPEMSEKGAEKAIMTTEIAGEEAVNMKGIWDEKIVASLPILRDRMKDQARGGNLEVAGRNAVFTFGTFRTLLNGKI